jgi:hypothetical protein
MNGKDTGQALAWHAERAGLSQPAAQRGGLASAGKAVRDGMPGEQITGEIAEAAQPPGACQERNSGSQQASRSWPRDDSHYEHWNS